MSAIIMDTWGDQSYERLLYPLLQYNESDYAPPTYVPPQIVSDAHLQPRFGRPNVLDGVIDGNKEQTREYVTGVIIGSLLIAIMAIVWFFAIICLKIAGTKRVGFLSGRFVRPYTTSAEKEVDHGVEVVLEGGDIDNQHATSYHEPQQEQNSSSGAATATHADPILKKNFEMRVGLVRVIFFLSGIAVIISGKIHSSFVGSFYLRIIMHSHLEVLLSQAGFSTGKALLRSEMQSVRFNMELTWHKT